MALKRRLILLLDGTWNEDGDYDYDTNIVRLRHAIAKTMESDEVPHSIPEVNINESNSLDLGVRKFGEYEYMMFYERGVGTDFALDRVFGGVFGKGLDTNIRRAYRFLSKHYLPGSEIFVFGFSRGAFTARSLIGFLGSAGLLRCDRCTPELEEKAWLYYLTPPNDRFPGIWRELEIETHPIGEVRVACLGVFDTVGALGIPATTFKRLNRHKYEFHDVELSPIVKLNLHALAVDENRRQFEASVWRKSNFRINNSVVEQVWFPGSHSDVGGGYYRSERRHRYNHRLLDDLPLDWMIKRLRHHFPDFPVAKEKWDEIIKLPIPALMHNSRTFKFRFSPFSVRAINNNPANLKKRWISVSENRDNDPIGECLHISVIEMLGRSDIVVGQKHRGFTRKRFYAPINVLINLPDLRRAYSNPDEAQWNSRDLKVVSWDGKIVNALDASKGSNSDQERLEKQRLQVLHTLEMAVERLRLANVASAYLGEK